MSIRLEPHPGPLHLDRGARLNRELHIRMARPERRGEARDHRERGRDRSDAQAAGEAVTQRVDFCAHGALVAHDAAGPVEHLLALGREAAKARAAVHRPLARETPAA